MIETIVAVVMAAVLAAAAFRVTVVLADRARVRRRVQMAGGKTSVSVESRLVEGAAGLRGRHGAHPDSAGSVDAARPG